MRAALVALALVTLAIAPAVPARAQGAGGTTPKISNGRVVPQAAGSSLDATFKRLVAAQSEPAWIGYSVPTVRDGTAATGLAPGQRPTLIAWLNARDRKLRR